MKMNICYSSKYLFHDLSRSNEFDRFHLGSTFELSNVIWSTWLEIEIIVPPIFMSDENFEKHWEKWFGHFMIRFISAAWIKWEHITDTLQWI